MNTRIAPTLTLSALSMAVSLLIPASAMAAPSAADLGKIKIYGDVTIAQDSTDQWGPWEQFEPPSAGPVKLSQLKFGSEYYRPQSNLNRPETPEPVQPELLAFGAFIDRSQEEPSYHAFSAAGTIKPASGESDQTVSFAISPFSTGTPLISNTGELSFFQGEGMAGYFSDSVSMYFSNEPLEGQNTAEVNLFDGELGQYISSKDSEGGSFLRTQSWAGVVGTPTSLADMSELRASNARATYAGYSFDNDGVWKMTMSYAFGPGTGQIVESRFTADVKGTSGALYTSTSLKGADGSSITGGQLKGAFFGKNAGATGGAYTLNKEGGTQSAGGFLMIKGRNNNEQ